MTASAPPCVSAKAGAAGRRWGGARRRRARATRRLALGRDGVEWQATEGLDDGERAPPRGSAKPAAEAGAAAMGVLDEGEPWDASDDFDSHATAPNDSPLSFNTALTPCAPPSQAPTQLPPMLTPCLNGRQRGGVAPWPTHGEDLHNQWRLDSSDQVLVMRQDSGGAQDPAAMHCIVSSSGS